MPQSSAALLRDDLLPTPLPPTTRPPAARPPGAHPRAEPHLRALPPLAPAAAVPTASRPAPLIPPPSPVPRAELPDPEPLATSLARCVVEILAGARDIEQIARWVTDDVFRHVQKRVALAARARSARGEQARRPSFSVGTVRVTEPADGIVEAVIIIHGRARSRAVALRLEAFNSRWRASAVHVL
ncbi:Rv3235 family protein [Frondihabitans peucedani]|uniref:3-hydroxyacyl-CoA dehydrogenase n=1 Tax=Frondihabitans peucedani TaxID=598626 RepID=A0ABP8DZC5_9MICO